MPKVDIRAKVAQQARIDFGAEPLSVVPAEDVYTGFLALLPDRVVFYKDLFGDLEQRNQYLYRETDQVVVADGFGGKEIRGRQNGKEMRLRRLTETDAELLLKLFRGETPALKSPTQASERPTPDGDAAPEPSTAPRAGPEPEPAGPKAPPKPIPDTSAIEAEWFEETPVRAPRPPKPQPAATAPDERSAPVKVKKGAGCLAWTAIGALGVAGLWIAIGLDARIGVIEGQAEGEESWRATLQAELDTTRLATQSQVEELRGGLERLRAELADRGEGPGPWPTAPPSAPLVGMFAGMIDQPPSKERYALPLAESPSRGYDSAWVTVVTLGDFQDPLSATVAKTVSDLQSHYGKDLRWVFKHLPSDLDGRAMAAAHAAECAREQGLSKFWRAHDHLYAKQAALSTKPMVEIIKGAGGMSMAKWKKCYSAERRTKVIAVDRVLAQKFGAPRAPALFVNGRRLLGRQSRTALMAVIDEELRAAKKSGLSRAKYYRSAVLEGGVRP